MLKIFQATLQQYMNQELPDVQARFRKGRGIRDKIANINMSTDSNMETYITICKIDSQWEFPIWLKELKLGLCKNWERWDGERDGGRFKREQTDIYLRPIHVDVWQKPT